MKKKKLSRRKKIIIIVVISILLLIAIIAVQNREKDKKTSDIKSYSSIGQFRNMSDVAIYLDSTFIGQERSSQTNFKYDVYMQIKYKPQQDDFIYERYYNQLINYSAFVLGYSNFRIIDKANDIEIRVNCNKENKVVDKILINGKENYFGQLNSQSIIDNMSTSSNTNIYLQASELVSLKNAKWNAQKVNIGQLTNTVERYDIYKDKGIKVNKISEKLINIVFTKDYKSNVVSGLSTSSSLDDVRLVLGEPTFSEKLLTTQIIGYKSDDVYVFFTGKEISVYPNIQNSDTEKLVTLEKQYLKDKNGNSLYASIRNIWNDYQINSLGYSMVLYPLRGIEFAVTNGNEIKISIYSNYSGYIYEGITMDNIKQKKNELPENIAILESNSVFRAEVNRNSEIHNIDEILASYKTGLGTLYEEMVTDLFVTYKRKTQNQSFTLIVLSRVDSYIDFQLKEPINSFLWVSNTKFVYGIKGKGIYLVDAVSRKEEEIQTGIDNFSVIEYKDGILKYDKKEIRLDV